MKDSNTPRVRPTHWFDRHRLVVDSTLAVLLFVISLPSTSAMGWTDSALWTSPVADPADLSFIIVPTSIQILFSAGIIAPLFARRIRPTLSAALTYSAALLQLLCGISLLLPADFAVLIALYSVTAYGTRRASIIAAVGAIVGSAMVGALVTLPAGDQASYGIVVGIVVGICFLAAWAMGMMRRSRLSQLEALAWRAERLERERDEQVSLAATEERTRIAREMHDIVAHSLSVLIAQADGGRYAAAHDPQAPIRSLETIAEVGRAALWDMRRLLGVLRSDPPLDARNAAVGGPSELPQVDRRVGDETAAAAQPARRTPQPGMSELPTLIDQVRNAGISVSFGTTGTARELPPGIGLVIYRICQEALTNVLKHAGPNPQVTVMVKWQVDALQLEVLDDGRGAAAGSDGLGQGIIGMTERAAMFGGILQAGPRAGGGYHVQCTIPIPTLENPT